LLQTEAVLNAEEAEVHQHNLAKRQGYLWGNLHFEATPGLYKKKTWNNKLRETLHSRSGWAAFFIFGHIVLIRCKWIT
jgi:hypothetical protein